MRISTRPRSGYASDRWRGDDGMRTGVVHGVTGRPAAAFLAPASARSARELGWRRVLVVGSAGAGKTTFATRLGQALGLPVIHLDSEYWRPGWQQTPEDEWPARV